jgi:outer membrane protein TolC
MKNTIYLLAFLLNLSWSAFAQLTIEDCQMKARENYPLIKKYDLIGQSKDYSLENANKAYLPQFQLNARTTYQSDVTSIPIEIQGIDIPSLKKDQYQATVEVSQSLWDGGAIQSQTQLIKANSEVEMKQLEVELYALEDRINQLFFGILLLNAQLEQNQILDSELQRNYTTISHYIENGIANQADLDAVKVEQLNAKQMRVQILSNKKAYIEMLSLMIDENINENTSLEKPDTRMIYEQTALSVVINRPEMQLFEAQNALFTSQKHTIKSSSMPRLGLFVQGGIGRPGLNMLSNAFEPFYIGGVRLSWNLGAFYTQKNDLRKIEINQNKVNTEKEIFLYNTHLKIIRENKDIQRIKDLMEYDDEIITLRENIRKAAEAKLANGTLTVTELMREMSAENLARQVKAKHEIDLLIAIYNLKNTTNK